jgi:hypothetical protein
MVLLPLGAPGHDVPGESVEGTDELQIEGQDRQAPSLSKADRSPTRLDDHDTESIVTNSGEACA